MNRFELRARYPGFELLASAGWAADSAALFGASGAGKTTILEALCGLRPEATGPVVLRDRRIDGLAPTQRGLGWVPQDAALFPHMSARENIDFAVRLRGNEAAARLAIEALELGPLLDRRAPELSGGERQRVAIARALASRPEFLLLDEPLASLDRPLRMRVLPFLAGLPLELGVPVLIVTHDPLEVLSLARHVLVLEAGRIVAGGDPHSVFASAATFGALHALGAENRFDVRVIERRSGTLQVETAAGTVLSMVRVEGFPEPSRVAIRSEDIMLAAGDPGRVSAQNVLPARVVGLESVGEQVYVALEVRGERWRAKVTTGAVQDLGIRAGSELVMLVKAHAILAEGE